MLAASALVIEKYTRNELMVIEGASSGGILIEAIINRWLNLAEVAIINGK
jgi:protease II